MEAAGDIAFRIDPSGLIRQASKRAARLLGSTADIRSDLRGCALSTLAIDVDQPALRNAIVDATARANRCSWRRACVAATCKRATCA